MIRIVKKATKLEVVDTTKYSNGNGIPYNNIGIYTYDIIVDGKKVSSGSGRIGLPYSRYDAVMKRYGANVLLVKDEFAKWHIESWYKDKGISPSFIIKVKEN